MGCGTKPVRYPIPRTVQQMTRFNRMGQNPYTESRILPKIGFSKFLLPPTVQLSVYKRAVLAVMPVYHLCAVTHLSA
jgi:hypothetical protein